MNGGPEHVGRAAVRVEVVDEVGIEPDQTSEGAVGTRPPVAKLLPLAVLVGLSLLGLLVSTPPDTDDGADEDGRWSGIERGGRTPTLAQPIRSNLTASGIAVADIVGRQGDYLAIGTIDQGVVVWRSSDAITWQATAVEFPHPEELALDSEGGQLWFAQPSDLIVTERGYAFVETLRPFTASRRLNLRTYVRRWVSDDGVDWMVDVARSPGLINQVARLISHREDRLAVLLQASARDHDTYSRQLVVEYFDPDFAGDGLSPDVCQWRMSVFGSSEPELIGFGCENFDELIRLTPDALKDPQEADAVFSCLSALPQMVNTEVVTYFEGLSLRQLVPQGLLDNLHVLDDGTLVGLDLTQQRLDGQCARVFSIAADAAVRVDFRGSVDRFPMPREVQLDQVPESTYNGSGSLNILSGSRVYRFNISSGAWDELSDRLFDDESKSTSAELGRSRARMISGTNDVVVVEGQVVRWGTFGSQLQELATDRPFDWLEPFVLEEDRMVFRSGFSRVMLLDLPSDSRR